MKSKCWKSNKQWKEGSRYDTMDKHLSIRGQTYGKGEQVDIWQSNPYKNILTKKFKTESKAKSFANKYMKEHEEC